MCACQYHYNVNAPCTCTCESHNWRRESQVEPEWVVGQQVEGDDYDRLPVGAKAWIGGSSQVTRGPATWVYDSGAPCVPGSKRTLIHLPDATQPEDATDAYVEPEPLKEGDWLWIAGQVTETHHHPEDVTVEMFSHNEQYQADVRRDRVRPMEGTPEWAKPDYLDGIRNRLYNDEITNEDATWLVAEVGVLRARLAEGGAA